MNRPRHIPHKPAQLTGELPISRAKLSPPDREAIWNYHPSSPVLRTRLRPVVPIVLPPEKPVSAPIASPILPPIPEPAVAVAKPAFRVVSVEALGPRPELPPSMVPGMTVVVVTGDELPAEWGSA